MSMHKVLITAVVIATTVLGSTSHLYAISVPLSSLESLPFSNSYPTNARNEVRLALQDKQCKFISGRSVNAISTIHFSGTTSALNKQLRTLADCPDTTIAVSFKAIDHTCDWQLVYDARSMTFQFVVNLESKQVSLNQLIIPPAQGPRSRP